MGKVWIGQTFFKLRQEDEPAEEISKEPNPEVVQEEGGPDGIFEDDVDVPQAGLEPGQPDRREVAGHPNALDEGQAGEPQAHEALAAKQPTPEERAQHELHHANFEPWCEKCHGTRARQASQKARRVKGAQPMQTTCFSPKKEK